MNKKRTTEQIDANKLDLECFRLINRIERFTTDHSNKQLAASVTHLNWIRVNIRRHMHPKDRERTSG